MEGHWKLQEVWVSKAKIIKRNYEAKLEFPEGLGNSPHPPPQKK